MRYPILAALLIALVGCTAGRAELKCDAATSYLSHELSNTDDEELVYGSLDDEATFNLVGLAEADRVKAVSEFAEEPWFDLKGTSVWQGEAFDEIAKTPDEIRMVRKLFEEPTSANAVTRCSEISTLLQSRSIAFGESAVKSVSAIENRELDAHSKTIADIYLPILSDDDRSALLLVSRSWAPLAGVGLIIKIERQTNGEWLPTRAQQIWVS
ncbi:hypothetical protein [Altericroceibacterium endophyticum]|uniref:Uncharacterized protein n=1 Tax=Altericroceibacterium endophyticum TaxID=1808508 RepID=A0A6I4T4M7_9SPHN|nr:hypothetical protein [Altericroceibacterium endophyticum]MXO66214.1 hypothetical protein [Altericroceibacterium endophyticum]